MISPFSLLFFTLSWLFHAVNLLWHGLTWTDAILYAYMSDPTVPEEDELALMEDF